LTPGFQIQDEIIPDLIFENLETVFWAKNTLMWIRIWDLVNPGSGIRTEKIGFRIFVRDKHPRPVHCL
jgi:hypothetical protein